MSVDPARERGLQDYRKKLLEHKEVESRLKESKYFQRFVYNSRQNEIGYVNLCFVKSLVSSPEMCKFNWDSTQKSKFMFQNNNSLQMSTFI